MAGHGGMPRALTQSGTCGERPTVTQLSNARAQAEVAITCARCGASNQAALRTCARCFSVRYCSRKCQGQHWASHVRDCWFMIALVDLAGAQQQVGPVHSSTTSLMIKDAAAAWKQTDRTVISLVHGTRRLRDWETLGSAEIFDGESVTVVVISREAQEQSREAFVSLFQATRWHSDCRCHRCRTWHEAARMGPEEVGRMEEVD